MSPEERLKIQSGPFDPASITIIDPSDFSYVGTGSVVLSSSATVSFGVSARSEFAWRIQGFVSSSLESAWRVGEGEYYWYRVEGECGQVECDTFGVQNRNCNRMTFTTVIPARDVAEVCEVMTSPVLNPPVQARIISIRKYSRPVLRTGVASPDCNILEDEEFCQIPECEDYCIDQRIVTDISLNFFAIEAVYAAEMSGGVNLSGVSGNDAVRNFTPVSPLIYFSGGSSFSVSYWYGPYVPMGFIPGDFSAAALGDLEVTGSAESLSSHRDYVASGSVVFLGASQNVSPIWHYPPPQHVLPGPEQVTIINEDGSEFLLEDGSLLILEPPSYIPSLVLTFGGTLYMGYFASALGGITLEGESAHVPTLPYDGDGFVEISGSLAEVVSPYYSYTPYGGVQMYGGAEFGFEDLGIISMNINLASSAFGLGYEFYTVDYESALTISDSSVISSCGCPSAGLSLNMSHNLFDSRLLSSFMDRNGLISPTSAQLRYRSSDSSWRDAQHYSGVLESGEYGQISIFFSLACLDGSWRFSFAVRDNSSRSETKFITDMPSNLVCGGNNIATDIELKIGRGLDSYISGESIYVVTPRSARPAIAPDNQLNVSVAGLQNDYVVYYDELGLFGESYWSYSPLKFGIGAVSKGYEMQVVDLKRIF